ncbi:hypothetical protein K435DRAFT_850425 [Dendrothele bispora CBS 962.96]|uniref:Uncharacterized protein n=1 Tax=Dendrothele bispora (strain CBS 962.96) TaxID=1314807 RepID=A0A4S8MPE8_DENBC|nr:hypothetical protein K435DRAFT_850425 [Dendrothele bispora CBS 962.96]
MDISSFVDSSSSSLSHTSIMKSDPTVPISIPSLPCGIPPQGSASRRASIGSAARENVLHPYARLYAKKDDAKRRKVWNHALEKSIFTTLELSTVGAPQRRTIYIASLENHVDQLHSQLLNLGFWPVSFDRLEPFKGLNSRTAKSMVATLQHEVSQTKLKLLELQRANDSLERQLMQKRPNVGMNEPVYHMP